MSDPSASAAPNVTFPQPACLTLTDVRHLIDSRANLNVFYSNIYARLSTASHVLISVSAIHTIHFRLNDLKRLDPDRNRLPLYAVPFIAKDNIDAPPHRTTAACPSYSYSPATPAHVIRQLESMGAILIGKSNMDQFACGLVGTRSPYGTPTNPHNNTYIPGGSSSGSAVAVATGLCAFSLGTDTAGSGRVPAAMNGIVGLKPTKGLLSTRGVVPAAESQDCVSVFANCVKDAAYITALLSAESDLMCAFSRTPPPEKLLSVEYGNYVDETVESFRFGVPVEDQLEFYEDDVAKQSYKACVALLERIGGQKVEIEFEPFREVGDMLYGSALVAERYTSVGRFVREKSLVNPMSINESVAKIIMNGDERKRAHEVFAAQKRVAELTMTARREAWSKMDVLVVPSVPCAMTVSQIESDPLTQNSMLGIYTNFVNLMDYCAVAVPGVQVMHDAKVPRGITVVGMAFGEKLVVTVASRFEEAVTRDIPIGEGAAAS